MSVRVGSCRMEWVGNRPGSGGVGPGCTPAPGAWTTFRGERVKIGPVGLATAAARMPSADFVDAPSLALAPGELHVTKRSVLVGTGSTPVELREVRPHGKKVMAAPDWARGVRITPGERFDG